MLLLAAPAAGVPRLEVGGRSDVVDGRLHVTLELRNDGDQPASALEIVAELAGRRAEAALEGPLAPGAADSVVLQFPAEVPRPGTHAVLVSIAFRHGVPPVPEGAPITSQRAFLIFPFGATPPPALALEIPDVALVHTGSLRVGVRNLDGVAHTAWLRVLPPRGLNAEPARAELDLAPGALGHVEARLLRGSAQRDARHGLIVVAGLVDGALERTTAGVGAVDVLPDRRWSARLRDPALVVAALLLVAAAVVELRRRPR